MPKFLTNRAALSAGARRRQLTIALYAIVVFLYWVSLYIYVPTLPTYVQGKSHHLALVGVVLAQYGLWQAIIRLPLGIAADWMGWHKPFILAGLALAGLGALALGAAEDSWRWAGRSRDWLPGPGCRWSSCSAACFAPTRRCGQPRC